VFGCANNEPVFGAGITSDRRHFAKQRLGHSQSYARFAAC
jgi:hypothetical protein